MLLAAASPLRGEAWTWGALAALAAACWPWRLPSVSALSICIGLLCVWMLLNACLISPGYTADSLYRPLTLFGGFVALSGLSRSQTVRLYQAGLALMCAIALLGLIQHAGLVQPSSWQRADSDLYRAAGTFASPNTFATAINLFLLPAIVVYLVSPQRSRWLLPLALLLFAGLVSTQSRGGIAALIAALGFVFSGLAWYRVREAFRPALMLLAAGTAVWLIVQNLAALTLPLAHAQEAAATPTHAWVERTAADRREIYGITLGLILERPLLGAGAGMFAALFEPHRPELFGEYTVLYAHSDYLQVWLEFGLLGVGLLLAIVALALGRGWRSAASAPIEPIPLACTGALAACFAHAMVDFPLHIGFLLFAVGGMLGVLAWSSAPNRVTAPRGAMAFSTPLRGALVFAGLVMLAQPAAAQLAGDRAQAVLMRGDIHGGIYWQSVARRLEPRNPMHYWAEAVMWRQLAQVSGDRKHWAAADRLLAEGMQVNPPYALHVTLSRAHLHRVHGAMLEHPASPEELLRWVQAVTDRAPRFVPGMAELARSLAHAGRDAQAREVVRSLAKQWPNSPLVKALTQEIR